MTSLFARNERLLWRTRFSTTEMPSQCLTIQHYKIMTILSVFFEVISPKHTRAWTALAQSADCMACSLQTAPCSLQTARGFQIARNMYTSWPRSAPTKDQVRSLFLPIVLLKMRYENVKLQMRLNQGPNDDVDGHEMNKLQWYQHNWGDSIEKYVYDQERSKLNDSLRSTSLNGTWEVACWFSFSLRSWRVKVQAEVLHKVLYVWLWGD